MVDRARTGPENTSGLRSVLSLAPAYRAAQRLIGADQARRFLTEEILSLGTHDRLLDIGCGTADILEHLPAVDYVGFDPSRRYVAAARSRFGDRGKFVTSLAALGDPGLTDRSVVLAIGVLHHMDDDQAHETLDLALHALRPGGRFVSFDPAFVDGQHWFARFLITRDRGRHVRTPDETAALFHNRFQTVDIQLRHDLLRTPYSHVIVQAFAL